MGLGERMLLGPASLETCVYATPWALRASISQLLELLEELLKKFWKAQFRSFGVTGRTPEKFLKSSISQLLELLEELLKNSEKAENFENIEWASFLQLLQFSEELLKVFWRAEPLEIPSEHRTCWFWKALAALEGLRRAQSPWELWLILS